MASSFSLEKLGKAKRTFDLLDQDKDGLISTNDLATIYENFGFKDARQIAKEAATGKSTVTPGVPVTSPFRSSLRRWTSRQVRKSVLPNSGRLLSSWIKMETGGFGATIF